MNGHSGFGEAGQRSFVPEGGAKEIFVFLLWSLCLFLLRFFTVFSVFFGVWVWGPYTTGYIAAAIVWLFLVYKTQQYLWPCVIVGMFVFVWKIWGAPTLWGFWAAPFGLRPDEIRPMGTWLGLAVLAPTWWSVWWFVDFRARKEITDKYFPGTILGRPAGGGAVGPGNPNGTNGLPAEDEPEQPAAQPARQPLVIITEHRGDNGKLRSSERQELSEQLEAKMPEIARYAIGLQTPFSEPQMAGRGKPLSKTSFSTIRDELLALGALEWKDPELRTVRWTIKGLDWCRTFNGSRPTPP